MDAVNDLITILENFIIDFKEIVSIRDIIITHRIFKYFHLLFYIVNFSQIL